ncbi:MAG: PspC domain-containing protein [Actinomycetota bacterium]
MESTTHDDGGTAEVQRRLRRPRAERQLGGVAAGLGAYVGVSPLFFRIAFVVLVFASGFGLFAYVGAWLLLPDDADTDSRQLAITASVPALVAGFATLIVGSIVLTSDISLDFSVIVPLGLVILGVWVLNQRRYPDEATIPFAAPAPPANPRFVPPPPSTPPPPTPWTGGSVPPPAGPTVDPVAGEALADAGFESGSALAAAGGETVTTPMSGVVPPTATGGVTEGRGPAAAPAPTSAPVAEPEWAAPSYRPPAGATGPYGPTGPGNPAGAWAQIHIHDDAGEPDRPEGPPIVPITLAASVVVIGAYLVIVNLSSLDVGTALAFGGILTALGGGLVASAFTRRALVLVPLALLTGFLLLISPILDATSNGGLGTRIVDATGDDLQSEYAIGAGELLIDLRDDELTENRRVTVDVGAGYTEIRLPDDIPVVVEARSSFGYLEVLGAVDEGVGNQVVVSDTPEEPQGATLVLEVSVTFGYAEVTRG